METMYKTKANHSISTAKATRLFWLGRYAERVYIALHQIRKHYDLMIDEDETAYISFCNKMGIENKYESSEDFMHKYLFDATNPDSVLSMLELVNDNAILLREEITSETLSYIQISISYMKNIEEKGKTINELQTVTDYMFAFWGSMEERIFSSQIRHAIKFGKYLECLDLHLRFNYPFERIEQIFNRMMESVDKEYYICDEITLLQLEGQITFDNYKEYKTVALLNHLFSPKN
ncbi:MAG: alpha-E domain-containing protein [Paludibacter sp.]